jgi:hypothetical protein
MPTIVKSMILGFGLAAGMSVGVHAQTAPYPTAPYPSVAALPPDSVTVAPAAPAAPIAPSAVVTPTHGPDPGKAWYPSEKQTRRVEPSPDWIGPKPN